MGKILKNIFWLLTVQVTNFALPLITLPYLGRVIGVKQFGVTMMALSFTQVLSLIIDYGFNLSATKQVSIHRENKSKINEIFSSIFIIKMVLMLGCLIALFVSMNFVNEINNNKLFFLLFFGMVLGNSLFPLWFFQGMEKMRISSILNVVTKITFSLLIILLVKDKSDFLIIPICYSIGYIISGVLGIYIAYKIFKINLYVPQLNILKKHFKESTSYFLSRISVSIYSIANTFIIGIVLGSTLAGYFSAAEKLYSSILTVISVIGDVLFPYMAKNKNIKVYKLISICTLALSLIGIAILFIITPYVITLIYGQGYERSITVLRILLISTIFAVPSILIGYPLLAAFGLERYTNSSVIIASCLHIVLLFIFIPSKSLLLYSSTLVITQFVVLAIRLLGVKKLKNMDRSKENVSYKIV
ncbi:hypothetical protein ASE46_02555 [Bacillus sp. Root239]|nr:hypothetical protein ASE46_02555 [Bacillus sp. Root239]